MNRSIESILRFVNLTSSGLLAGSLGNAVEHEMPAARASVPERKDCDRIAIRIACREHARRCNAEAAGDRQKAVRYFEKLVALSSKADTPRPELARAKAFLGQR